MELNRIGALAALCIAASTSGMAGAATLGGPITVYKNSTGDFAFTMHGDVDADGKADLMAWTPFQGDGFKLIKGRALSDGKWLGLGGYVDGRAVAVGDMDGDGDADLVTTTVWESDAQPRLVIAFNDGRGRFPVAFAEQFYGDSPWAIALGDVDRDGDLDVVGRTANGISVLRNPGANGSFFGAVVTNQPVSGDVQGIDLSDLDGDGDLDLLLTHAPCCTGGAPAGVMLGDGGGGFAAEAQVASVARTVASSGFADIDGDGDRDVVLHYMVDTGTSSPNAIAAYRNDGGTLTALPLNPVMELLFSIALGDVDHDGRVDVLATTGTRTVLGYSGNGAGAFGGGTPLVLDAGIDARFARVADVDGDGFGDAVIGAAGKVVVMKSGPGGMGGGGSVDPLLVAILLACGSVLFVRRRAEARG